MAPGLLSAELRRLRAEPVIVEELGESPPELAAAHDGAWWWRAWQCSISRLSPALAEHARERALQALRADGGELGGGAITEVPDLPALTDKVLIEPAIVEGTPVGGLRLSRAAAARVPALVAYADLVTVALAAAAVDPELCVCWDAVRFGGGLHPLDDAIRALYETQLTAQLAAAAAAPYPSPQYFRELVALDEGLAGLLHRPPARTGWPTGIVTQSRRLLRDEAGELARQGLAVDQLALGTMSYEATRKRTDPGRDVPMRLPPSVPGGPGDVLACLRVWAEIDSRAQPGRVIYRLS